MVIQVKTAPVSRMLMTPVSTAVRNAISRPLEKSFQSRVRNFDFMSVTILGNFHDDKVTSLINLGQGMTIFVQRFEVALSFLHSYFIGI